MRIRVAPPAAIYTPGTGALSGDRIASRAALRLSLEAGAISGVAEHYKDVERSQVLAARAEHLREPYSTAGGRSRTLLCGVPQVHGD